MEIFLVICTVLGGLAAVVYFWEKIYLWITNFFKAESTVPPRQNNSLKQAEISTSKKLNNDTNSLTAQIQKSSTVFFYERFVSAFPGVRGIEWYNRKEAIKRLKILFQEPIVLETNNRKYAPFWHWRDGNMSIDQFRVLDRKTVLIWFYELQISRIAAVNKGSYYQCFVYLEADPMEPTGLYPRTKESIRESQEKFGYVSEEYGLYKEKYKVTRAEYDDNAAAIKGKIVKLGSDAKIRVRFITPYNLIVAPHNSPINNNKFDIKLEEFMNKILKNEASLDELSEEILKLPKREFEYRT